MTEKYTYVQAEIDGSPKIGIGKISYLSNIRMLIKCGYSIEDLADLEGFLEGTISHITSLISASVAGNKEIYVSCKESIEDAFCALFETQDEVLEIALKESKKGKH
jgi:hypothetical protein